MPLSIAMCLLLASVQTPGSAAQDKPSFAGEWLLVAPVESAPSIARKITVAAEAASITVTRGSNAGTESTRYQIGPATPATATSGQTRPGPNARWSERSLMLAEGKCGEKDTLDTCADRTEQWSIDQKGLLTIELKTYGPGKRIETKTLIYRRPGA